MVATSSSRISEHESVHHGTAHPAKVVEHRQLADDDPEIWGWHHTFGKGIRIFAWIVAVIMLVMMIGNHQGRVEDIWLGLVALVMIGMLVYDISRRRKGWRQ